MLFHREEGKQFRSAIKAVGLDDCYRSLRTEILYSVTSHSSGGVENRSQELSLVQDFHVLVTVKS